MASLSQRVLPIRWVQEPPEFLGTTLVLIPALNEAESLPLTIQFWRSLGVSRIRVVDNGSTDQTATVAREHGADLLFEPRRGYGAAAWRGMQDWPTGAEWILFSAADGSDRLTLGEAALWQEHIDSGADLIMGDRTVSMTRHAQSNFSQRAGNWFVCRAIELGWGRSFRDLGSLRLIRHATLMSLELQDRGFGWNVEMQIRALQHGLKIIESPVVYHARRHGQSKISGTLRGTLRAGWGILSMLAKLWEWRRAERRPASRVWEVRKTGPIG